MATRVKSSLAEEILRLGGRRLEDGEVLRDGTCTQKGWFRDRHFSSNPQATHDSRLAHTAQLALGGLGLDRQSTRGEPAPGEGVEELAGVGASPAGRGRSG